MHSKIDIVDGWLEDPRHSVALARRHRRWEADAIDEHGVYVATGFGQSFIEALDGLGIALEGVGRVTPRGES